MLHPEHPDKSYAAIPSSNTKYRIYTYFIYVACVSNGRKKCGPENIRFQGQEPKGFTARGVMDRP